MLSILTASTGPSDLIRSPVNGEMSGRTTGTWIRAIGGTFVARWWGDPPDRLTASAVAPTATAATAAPTAATTLVVLRPIAVLLYGVRLASIWSKSP